LPTPKQFRRRLRSRIIISFLILGSGLTALFAVATIGLRARLENQLVDNWLSQEAQNFVEFKRLNPEPEAQFQFYRQIELFVFSRAREANIPLAWRSLPEGVHDITEPDPEGEPQRYKLAVHRASDLIGFLRYDYSKEALGQRQLLITLITAVALFSVLAGLIGVWSSRRVMQPVAELARRVEGYSSRSAPEKLAPHFAEDEVGQLASALDDYAEQLTERVTRDREFNADVSHELRTPLAVIRGAVELIQSQPDLNDKTHQRLQRIERAVQQCTDLITALLMLSRGERGSGATDVRRLAEQLAEANRVNIGTKPIEVIVEGQENVQVDAPEAIVAVALGNLIVNAFKYTREGEIRISVLGDRVEVRDTGPGIPEDEAAKLFERGYRGSSSEGSKGGGIGLAIVRRLCELYDWKVSLAPRADRQGAIATLEFAAYMRSARATD
jgi:signal transduction histidine kinase